MQEDITMLDVDESPLFPTLEESDPAADMNDPLRELTCLLGLCEQLADRLARHSDDRSPWLAAAQHGANMAREALSRHLTKRSEGLGPLITQRRQTLGWTQKQLAERAGLSTKHIARIEHGIEPGAGSLAALLGVSELGLLPTQRADHIDPPTTAPNWWIAPDYLPLRMLHELRRQLQGSGGALLQTSLYLDHQSAEEFLACVQRPDHLHAYRQLLPLDAAVKHIKECVRSAGVDVIALGSGDGIVETQLVEKIASDAKNDIRFYLLDISHPLLSTAFRHAEDTFASKRGVFVCAMHGNFFHLSRYPQLHYRPTQAHRRRLYTMLGFTFANLENERHFLQQSLSGAAEGDLLLVDLNLAQGAPDDVDTLRKKEPSLSNGALDDISTRWLSGPIRRYAEDVTKVDTFVRLDPYCPIPGSYALEFVASCHLGKTQRKEFALLHARRYQVEPLSEALRSIGWATVATLKFGGTAREPTHALMLFQRMRK
jgi:transcriptional regulator with XRE-family HTH domain